MWAKPETWIQKIAKILKTPPADHIYPNDRLPSEQVVPTFALRGFRGTPPKYLGDAVMVSAAPYFKAEPLDAFVQWHASEMKKSKRVAPELVLKDILRLEDIAHSSDAVLVVPCW